MNEIFDKSQELWLTIQEVSSSTADNMDLVKNIKRNQAETGIEYANTLQSIKNK
jgi:hypothetical protein